MVEALNVSSPIKLLKSLSPGHWLSPVLASPSPVLGPDANKAFPVDKTIPSLKGKDPLGSIK